MLQEPDRLGGGAFGDSRNTLFHCGHGHRIGHKIGGEMPFYAGWVDGKGGFQRQGLTLFTCEGKLVVDCPIKFAPA